MTPLQLATLAAKSEAHQMLCTLVIGAIPICVFWSCVRFWPEVRALVWSPRAWRRGALRRRVDAALRADAGRVRS